MVKNTRGRKKRALAEGVRPVPAVVSLESDVESTASIGTNGSLRSKIAKPVLKQLFYDIEHAGGIHAYDKGVKQALNILLDKGDPVIFGFRGDKIRKRLTCKVSQWKKLSREKYLIKLLKLGVQPAESLPKGSIIPLVPKPPKHPVIPEDETVPDQIVFSPDQQQIPRGHSWRIDSDAIHQRLLDRNSENYERSKEAEKDSNLNILPSSKTFEANMRGA